MKKKIKDITAKKARETIIRPLYLCKQAIYKAAIAGENHIEVKDTYIDKSTCEALRGLGFFVSEEDAKYGACDYVISWA